MRKQFAVPLLAPRLASTQMPRGPSQLEPRPVFHKYKPACAFTIARKHIMSATVNFPLYPDHPVFVAYHDNVASETLATVKEQLIARNPAYDFCFLSTTHIASWEQLRCALHRAVQNMVQGTMKANSVNTEIIFSLSPVNNMNDALKRFGVDEQRADVIVVKIGAAGADTAALQEQVSALLGRGPLQLSDNTLLERHDAKKFRKLFKLLDAADTSPQGLARGAVAASLLRGL